uniref:UPAR/Ly6 domain-containing protein n=1 Tax=Sus scrofa TaxID=9823 RepID=A0A4X1UV07_PIG
MSPGAMKGPWLVLLVVLLCSELGECQGSGGTCLGGHGRQFPCEPRLQAPSLVPTGKGETYFMSCAPSCQAATQMMQELAATTNPKSEVQDVACCQNDLCNTAVAPAGRSLWALAGGLLFSLGPTLLWALQ